jgi:hypothetical protein
MKFAYIDGSKWSQAVGEEIEFMSEVYQEARKQLQAAGADRVYYFLPYTPSHKRWYYMLKRSGYLLVFESLYDAKLGIEQGVQAELMTQADQELERGECDQVLIITEDAVFADMVSRLYQTGVLDQLLTVDARSCPKALKQAAQEKIAYAGIVKLLVRPKA